MAWPARTCSSSGGIHPWIVLGAMAECFKIGVKQVKDCVQANQRRREDESTAAAVSHATWNVGGVASSTVEAGLRELLIAAGGTLEVLSLQEVARGEPGWDMHQFEKWVVYSYKDENENEWRGLAIAYRSDLWTLRRKKNSPKGVWVRFCRVSDGAEIWCGSCYLTQGATRETHAGEVHSFLDVLPPTTLPVLIGGDMNTPVRWSQGKGDEPVPNRPQG